MQPLDKSLSPEAWETVTVQRDDGSVDSGYPLILLKAGRSIFTSACLPLRKAPAAA
jgi:hypothetical protein